MINPFHHHRATAPFEQWSSKDCMNMFPNFSDRLKTNSEITYQAQDRFDEYKGKTLMIVGGGPSSAQGWQEKEYDFLWSMNHFYKNPIFRKTKVDLAMIMGEPNINDPEFLRFREENKTLIGFEIHDRWENYSFDNYQNYFCMHTRFYGKIGVGARMKIFASMLGFKKVYFTGCDGPAAIFSGDHFFEPGKKTLPSVFNGLSLDAVSSHWKLQYDFFWDYVRSINPDTKFENLGGGEEYHEKCR